MSITVLWTSTKDSLPNHGDLIVKRWKSGAVWAGVYSGSAKDSSFDEWVLLERKVNES